MNAAQPTDTIRDAFEAMLWFLACVIGPLRSRKITPAEEIGALAACEVETDFEPDEPPAPLLALRDLVTRAAEEHNRRAAAGGADWTPERIREARERCERATPGPWTSRETDAKRSWREIAGTRRPVIEASGFTRTKNGESEEIYGVWMRAEDAAFIAHAREDLPAALAEIERLTAELAARAPAVRYDHGIACPCPACSAQTAAMRGAFAEASLEARAKAALSAFDACPVWADDSLSGDEKEHRAMIDAVRVADASRPGHPIGPLAREAGTISLDWIRGVRAAADVAASYNRDSTHPYRLDDCILAKLNVGGEPRANDHASRLGLTEGGAHRCPLRDCTVPHVHEPTGETHGLTEEQADAIALGCLQVRADLQRHAIKRAILRVDRGETGPAPTWGEQAIAERHRAAEPEPFEDIGALPPTLDLGIGGAPIRVRPIGLTSIMADAQQRPSVPPASAFGEWPEPERSGLTCPGCYAATGIATPCKGPLLSPAEQADPSFADALLVAQDRHREAAAVHPTTETDRQRATLRAGDPAAVQYCACGAAVAPGEDHPTGPRHDVARRPQ